MGCNTPEENALELMQDEEHAATYCANCDTEATVRLTIDNKTTFCLCAQCKDAFDWGMARADSDIDEEEL